MLKHAQKYPKTAFFLHNCTRNIVDRYGVTSTRYTALARVLDTSAGHQRWPPL